MIFGIVLLILGGYLLFTGGLPVRNFRIYSFSSLGGIWARLAGLMIWLGVFYNWLPVDIPYGGTVFYGSALVLLIIALVKELSGSIR